MWNAGQEAMKYVYRELKIQPEVQTKHYLSKYDLAALIEYDTTFTISRAVSEQHQLCWLLGFVCGVRPGSIGTSRHRKDQFLQVQDIQIKRSGGPYNFQATITFRWLKGYRDENRKRYVNSKRSSIYILIPNSLVFTCGGPSTPDEVIYSIPHRLLALLLRRGYLQDHDSVDSLLSGTEVSIATKESAQDKPIVATAMPQGVGLDQDHAATCDAISAYVQRRARDFGLPIGITHYAWRRSAGESSMFMLFWTILTSD